jgi:dipeptidyl aminopeptidase/acylaminoacyl peptidase
MRQRRLACRVLVLCAASLSTIGLHPVSEGRNRRFEERKAVREASKSAVLKRRVTIQDAIEMTRLADPEYLGGDSSAGRVAQFSPDRTKFVVLLRKGNVDSNTNEYSLLLWRTHELSSSPKPDVLLRLSSSSNRPAMQSVRWQKDSETILFLGEHPGERQQLYRFNCQTRRLRRITNSPTNVLSYGVGNRNLIAYTAEPLEVSTNQTWQHLGRPISTELVTEVLTGRADEHWSDHVRIVVQRADRPDSASTLAEKFLMPFPYPDDHPVISPDGNFLLLLANAEQIPASWTGYSESRMQKWTRWTTTAGQYSMLRRWVLIDTRTKRTTVLLNAPISLGGGGSSEAAWLPDGQSVVITNTYLPLEDVSFEEREARRRGPYVAEIKVPTSEITKVSSGEWKLLGWDDGTNGLIFEEGRGNAGSPGARQLYFQKQGGRWEGAPSHRTAANMPDIVLEEGINHPPQIVALQPDGKRSLLLDLNPQFSQLEFGREEQIRWKAKDGHEVEGGLYYPPDYVAGHRYPLVIQTHGFWPDRFEIDGPYTSAFAAQPLAAKGIMVLQAEKPDRAEIINHLATGKEAEWRVSAYEGAVDFLDSEGLIDRERVGIMGFSRTCWYVKYALTHSRFPYAAVSVSDGIDMGYFSYAAMANRAYPGNEIDQIMGATPSGVGMERWIAESPGFSIDKVSSAIPLRMVASYALDVLVEWEWFSMMKRLQKPVDMVVFLDGVHLLEKPLNRMISQGGNVDWFDFWLNGHEDPDREKAEQYDRWRKLREITTRQSTGSK